jgi:hypothetical protein
MNYREKLVQLRTHAFRRTEEAAKKGNTAEVNRFGRMPKECEDAMELLENLESQIARIEADLRRTELQPRPDAPSVTNGVLHGSIRAKSTTSPRQKANQVRTKYVIDLSKNLDIQLQRRSEVIYQTQSGKTVAIPYATELTNLPDRWWLGLPDEHFHFIVLLCETRSDELLDFVLPSHFVSEIWNSLSRDSKLHVKLNVFRAGADFDLRLKDGVTKKIRRFLGGGEVLTR